MATLSSKAVGSIVKLKVDGTLRDFIVVHQARPSGGTYDGSCIGTWLLMKDIYEERQWNSWDLNSYLHSSIHGYLNNDFLAKFDADIRTQIRQVTIPYWPGGTISCKIFLLSGYEVGWTTDTTAATTYQYLPAEGAKLAYFEDGTGTSANNKRVGKLNGSATGWWLRSPYTYDDACDAWFVVRDGSSCPALVTYTNGIRPALILPSSLSVSYDGTVTTNTAPTRPGSITVPDTIKGGSTITVSWSAATDAESNLEGYIVERSINGGTSWSQIYQGTALKTTNTVAAGTQTVMYRVKSYDSEGLYSSYRTSNTAPTTPENITVPEFIKDGSVAVAWGTSTDADGNFAGYALERQTDGGEWSEVYRGRETSYRDSVTGWTQLSYRVRAYDSEGAYSGYAELTLQSGDVLAMITTGDDTVFLPGTGEWELTISKDGETVSETVNCMGYQDYTLDLAFVHIYGASWDGTSTTKWTRTDDAAGFTDPVPYVAGASSYGSPFDTLQPWAGMVKEERTGGTMVAIPKFWYKLTQSGKSLKIQIADKATAGFSVSPAHMDRGDGKGERDVVYVGRYHCATSNYKSKTGEKPKASITRATARTEIHKLGSNIWQMDFATRFTIWLLYLVEFADWNSQKTIGKGCGDNSNTGNMGYTDSMPYHTGTTQSSRDTYGLGTQYRYIEGLWDNVYDWEDGCYNSNSGLMIILNLNNYSDTSGGTSIGTPCSDYPAEFTVSNAAGFPMFFGSKGNGSDTVASCDNWDFYASYPCVLVGGSCGQNGCHGLFYVHYSTASEANAGTGSRLHELP